MEKQKQAYQKPKLRCYGSIEQITLGSTGTRGDGFRGTRRPSGRGGGGGPRSS